MNYYSCSTTSIYLFIYLFKDQKNALETDMFHGNIKDTQTFVGKQTFVS